MIKELGYTFAGCCLSILLTWICINVFNADSHKSAIGSFISVFLVGGLILFVLNMIKLSKTAPKNDLDKK